MSKAIYYPEDVLIEKMQRGEIGWLGYVNHFSAEWQKEYEEYCKDNSLTISDETAEQFVHHKSQEFEETLSNVEA